jgi:hypothetical protein
VATTHTGFTTNPLVIRAAYAAIGFVGMVGVVSSITGASSVTPT